jgi:histidine triad (HIT) family protein
MDCVFCKVVAGEAPSTKVYESTEILAFRNIKPEAPVHIVVIPKKHISSLAEVTEEDKELLGKLQLVIAEIAKQEGVEKSYTSNTNVGTKAGQSIFHLHYHLKGWKEG